MKPETKKAVVEVGKRFADGLFSSANIILTISGIGAVLIGHLWMVKNHPWSGPYVMGLLILELAALIYFGFIKNRKTKQS